MQPPPPRNNKTTTHTHRRRGRRRRSSRVHPQSRKVIRILSDHHNSQSVPVWTMRIAVHHAGAAGWQQRASEVKQIKKRCQQHGSAETRIRQLHHSRAQQAQHAQRHAQASSSTGRAPQTGKEEEYSNAMFSIKRSVRDSSRLMSSQTRARTAHKASQSRGAPRWHTAQGCESRAKAKAASPQLRATQRRRGRERESTHEKSAGHAGHTPQATGSTHARCRRQLP